MILSGYDECCYSYDLLIIIVMILIFIYDIYIYTFLFILILFTSLNICFTISPPLCLVCYTIDLPQPFGSRPLCTIAILMIA